MLGPHINSNRSSSNRRFMDLIAVSIFGMIVSSSFGRQHRGCHLSPDLVLSKPDWSRTL
jgi:hypothetical protein